MARGSGSRSGGGIRGSSSGGRSSCSGSLSSSHMLFARAKVRSLSGSGVGGRGRFLREPIRPHL